MSFDALRPDVLGPYGGERRATPNIDRFASESVVFENAYSVAPVTPTSFAAMFSGLLPTRVFHGWQFRAEPTFAGMLSSAGYETVGFFNNVQLTPERGFDRGFNQYTSWHNAPDELVLDEVLSWLGSSPQVPFFLWVHFLTPHAPYDVQPGAEHLYEVDVTQGSRFATTSGNQFEALTDAERGRLIDLYLGEVWLADTLFGRLVDFLRERGFLDESLVVLTSDHGEEFGEHGGFQHGRLYEEHLKVPLVIRHPDAKGKVEARIVRSVDLVPTLLAAVGNSVEIPMDGINLNSSTRERFLPVVGTSMTGAKERWLSLLEGPWKVIVTCRPSKALELFDLSADPLEKRNLSEEQPRIVREMLRRLGTILGGEPCSVMDAAVQDRAQTVGLKPESVEALRALGYLE